MLARGCSLLCGTPIINLLENIASKRTSWYVKKRSHSPLTGSFTAAGYDGTADVFARLSGKYSRLHLAAVGICKRAVGGLMPPGCEDELKRGTAPKTPRAPAVKAPQHTSDTTRSAMAAVPHAAAVYRWLHPGSLPCRKGDIRILPPTDPSSGCSAVQVCNLDIVPCSSVLKDCPS